MPRPNRPVVWFCIGVVAVAAVLPGISGLDYALFEPQWILLPDETARAVSILFTPGDEQSLTLLSLLPSRAPPSLSLA